MGTKLKTPPAAPPEDKARDATEAFLKPIIDGVTVNYGAQEHLRELLSQHLGGPVGRRNMSRWLNGSAQPSLGVGLCLREVFEKNKKKICEPWDAAKRRKPRSAKKPNETT